MSNYDTQLRGAKDAVTNTLLKLISKDPGPWTLQDLAARIDDLNKAWDELTDALVRQRETRDRFISELVNRLAEAERR